MSTLASFSAGWVGFHTVAGSVEHMAGMQQAQAKVCQSGCKHARERADKMEEMNAEAAASWFGIGHWPGPYGYLEPTFGMPSLKTHEGLC